MEDADECVNDTYLKAWTAIPPQKPNYFFAFLAKICRYLCFEKLDYQHAKKQNFDLVPLSDELLSCIPESLTAAHPEYQVIGDTLKSYLEREGIAL